MRERELETGRGRGRRRGTGREEEEEEEEVEGESEGPPEMLRSTALILWSTRTSTTLSPRSSHLAE